MLNAEAEEFKVGFDKNQPQALLGIDLARQLSAVSTDRRMGQCAARRVHSQTPNAYGALLLLQLKDAAGEWLASVEALEEFAGGTIAVFALGIGCGEKLASFGAIAAL